MRKGILFLIFSLLLVSSVSALGVEHGINGFVDDADDGIYANGAAVVFFIDIRPDERLTDMVGFGNAGQYNWYSIDVKNFPTPWQTGDVLIIMIVKDAKHSAMTNITLSDTFNEQQAPSVQLGQCEGAYCSYCGDDICDLGCNETLFSCPQDCGGAYCGDGVCSGTENYLNCVLDCPVPLCGNNICEWGEDHVTCPEDCGLGCNYDGICDFGESFLSCPDCMIESCGNMFCEPIFGESEETCPVDCAPIICGDGICEAPDETSENCPTDCKRSRCGNKVCEIGETKENCCTDCDCDVGECVNNKCVGCGFLGIYGKVIGLCWYIWAMIIILAVVGVYLSVRWKMKQASVVRHFTHVPIPSSKKRKRHNKR